MVSELILKTNSFWLSDWDRSQTDDVLGIYSTTGLQQPKGKKHFI